MHPNPAYRKADSARNIAFARERSFGVLAVNGAAGPMLSHVPFQVSADGKRVEAHLVRSNPIARALMAGESQAVIAVQGPDGYVSPDWYGIENQVPTWNYVAVHLRGVVRLLPDADLRGVLERLSGAMEARLLPKPIWLIDKVEDEALGKMLRMIVPIEMDVGQIDGTWKLSQNKPDGVYQRAGVAMGEQGFGSEVAALAALMRDPPV
jgi:transcriptional regulator